MRIIYIGRDIQDEELKSLQIPNHVTIEIDHAKGYEAFRKRFVPGKYAAILLNSNLPCISAVETLQQIRSIAKDVPCVVISDSMHNGAVMELLSQLAIVEAQKGSLCKLQVELKQAKEEREMALAEKEASEVLRTKAAIGSGILSVIPSNIGVINKRGELIYVNENWIKFSAANGGGTTEADYHGVNYLEVCKNFITGGDSSAVAPFEGVNDILSGKRSYFVYEYPCHSPDAIRWFIMKVTPFHGNEGGAVVIHSDITERVIREQEVRQTRKRFKDALNQAPDAVIIANDEGKIVFFSQQAEDYFGYKYEQVLGKPVEILIPDRYAHVHQHHRNGYAQKPERRAMGVMNNLIAKRKDGSEFPVDINLGPLNWDGSTGTMVMMRDITKRKVQEEEIRKLSMVASKINNGVFIGDGSFYPTWVNEGFLNQTGYTLKDIEGRLPYQIFSSPNEDAFARIKAIMKALKNGKAVHEEMFLRKKNGDGYWASVHATPVMGGDGRMEQLIAIMTDITPRKMAEIERDELFRTLEMKVDERTEELSRANTLLVDRNKDITDSISYAKHIQNAFIQHVNPADIGVKDFFVIDIPRDILSGDFHWTHQDNAYDCSYIAIGDCTGHGVPGALMTILAVQLLKQYTLGRKKKRNPKQVVMETDAAITDFLGQTKETSMLNDGMELSLFRIDQTEKYVHFVNIGRDVYYFSSGELKVYKGLKAMVGGAIRIQTQDAEEHCVEFRAGDRIYTFSDGFVDQFGGDEKKKMLRRRKKAFLLKIQSKPFIEHKELLERHFLEWKGDNFQVDDVIAFGMEF
ncbi:MAG: PAS domain S-box protein [Flavobacteriales bacterium]|nr:PAS domain S-box protein [Flavobacteriales bacterium]